MQLQTDNLGKVAITIKEGYWDINNDYDVLTVVEVKDKFATYVSRKPVPSGTVLTDRKYWIPFSSLKEEIVIDYNKFIDTYKNILKEYGNSITIISNSIDVIKATIETIQTDINTINTRLNNIKAISDYKLTHILN